MSLKLRDLIRKVRACKTAAEERAVIAKESAMIRTAIREEQAHFRHRNVAKLLYMHMLGYPTHFGQLECMKLTASPHFPEKRIGYLGLMLLLSEDADVLMLATNALKNDLASDNKFVAGLALCAIGNLATSDMSRDLAPEVDKHLKSNLAYLRKKASLAMSRCLAKCPDMVEDFVERAATLLRDKSHGVLVTVVQLLTQMLLIDFDNAQSEGEDPWSTSCRVALLNLVPTFVKMLRNLQSSSGYDDAVSTGNDPFLQVQLLTLLRLLGINNSQACEEMNDVLAQVATANTSETAKNAGNAILYECVQTIMATKSEDGLRVLAVNILGRFLLNRDNNIRYVALNTLGRCMVEQQQFDNGTNSAMSALQRHRQTIVECLKDPDISIRQRSLELIYHLVNKQNVENLTAELLNYLVLCPREHQRDISSRIVQVVDQHSPSDQWRVDTLITTLTIAGREATKQVQSITCVYISRASREVQSFATHKLMKAIRDDDGTQEGLLSVGVWCVGEYGDLLLEPCTYTPSSNESGNTNPITIDALDGSAIVDTLEKVISKRCPEQVLQRALTAFCKLTQRLSNDSIALSKIDKILQKHHISHSLELQLRACEYTALVQASKGIKPAKIAKPVVKEENSTEDLLFGSGSEDFSTTDDAGPVSDKVKAAAKEALNRMPVIDIKLIQKRLASSGDSFSDNGMGSNNAKPAATKTKGEVDLLDLEDIFGGGGGGGAPATNGSAADTKTAPINGDLFGESTPAATSAKSDPDAGKSDLDLLSDIFATQATTSSPASAAAPFDMFATPAVSAPAPPAAVNPLDLFGTPSIQSSAPVPAVASTSATFDLFGSSSSQPVSNGINNMQQPQAATPIQSSPFDNDLFGSSSVTSAPAPAQNNDVTVPGLSFNGLVVEFKCTKPDTYNAQKSTLIAHFKNTSGAPLYGMNLQVAVPKYVTMELEPPSSTTIPNSATASVTQKVTVTNSMIGTKNLMLKLKVSFTLNGNKLEHMATCSGFPAGEY